MSLLNDVHATAQQIHKLSAKLDIDLSDLEHEVKQEKSKSESIESIIIKTNNSCYPIRDHYMKETEESLSYINLLVFTFLLLKKYAVKPGEGARFINRVRKSIGVEESLKELVAAELSDGNINVQWIKDVKDAEAESIFAVEAILLYEQMQAGEKGLEQLVRIFTLLGCDEELVSEAAEAAQYIENEDWTELYRAGQNWKQVNCDLFEGYFTKKKLADSKAVKDEKAEIVKLQRRLSECYYGRAYQCFREAAENDDHRAQLLVGISFHYGLGVNKNSAAARSWLEKVAKIRCEERSVARAELKLLDQEKVARKSGTRKTTRK